jgi:hypothetical protein
MRYRGAMSGLTTRLPETRCPWCGKKIDAVSHLTGDFVPKPGDLTVCLGCNGTLVIGADHAPRLPLKAEIEWALFEDPDCERDLANTKRAIGMLHARFPESHRPMKGKRR